jgi:hypothetical protein
MNVFFYGLFMDEALLAAKGIYPSKAEVGYVDGFALRIGERATLIRFAGGRSYGVMMNISSDEAKELYAENSVADYEPESVTVELLNGGIVEACCYNLPVDKVTGTNEVYAQALLELANRLGLPESYLVEIGQAGFQSPDSWRTSCD